MPPPAEHDAEGAHRNDHKDEQTASAVPVLGEANDRPDKAADKPDADHGHEQPRCREDVSQSEHQEAAQDHAKERSERHEHIHHACGQSEPEGAHEQHIAGDKPQRGKQADKAGRHVSCPD